MGVDGKSQMGHVKGRSRKGSGFKKKVEGAIP